MTVRRLVVAFTALIALWFSAGCGGGGNAVTPDETTDPVYQQAQDLKKQGRYGEALNAFIKVIERRGEKGAPESHLEAGNLYLNWSHDPVEAYHHFSEYLQLQPTGPRADMVRGQRDAAKRELARTLLAPSNPQAVGADSDEIADLKRQLAELRAENAALRGSSTLPITREAPATPPMIPVPEEPSQGGTAGAEPASSGFVRSFGPQPSRSAGGEPTPPRNPPVIGTETTQRTETPTRASVAPTRPAATPRPAAGRRTHTVTSSEKSLWGIARRYYGGSTNNAKVQAIFEANRGVMRSPNDLRPGMVLVIP